MVSHLLRIRSCQNCERRRRLAQLHRHGRLLPERPAPHMDRLVRPAIAALVSRFRRRVHARHRAFYRLDAFPPASVPHSLLLYRHAIRDFHHSYRQLHFLNYLVFLLGFLLLDDRLIEWIAPQGIRNRVETITSWAFLKKQSHTDMSPAKLTESPQITWRERLTLFRRSIVFVCLGFVFYAATAQLIWMFAPAFPLPQSPVRALEPFRIANRYGLFAVMTHGRYEIEFQGSQDGKTWTAYPFRYKPQDIHEAPGIYAPYQPRFDWNLWFASLGPWQDSRFVVWTEERLIKNNARRPRTLRQESFPQRAAPRSSLRDLPILVHRSPHQKSKRRLVASRAPRRIRPRPSTPTRRQNRHPRDPHSRIPRAIAKKFMSYGFVGHSMYACRLHPPPSTQPVIPSEVPRAFCLPLVV